MKNLLKRLPPIHWFDVLIGFVVVAVLLSFFFFFYRKAEYILIRVKVTDQEVLTASNEPKNVYSWQFHTGDIERDVVGRVVTEVTNVETFPTDPEHKAIYLTLRVRATYDTRTQTFAARGKTLMYGTPMRFYLNNVTFDSFVVDVPNLIPVDIQSKTVKVKALSRGVEPSVAAAVKVGDTVKDSQGKELLRITKVTSTPAEQVTQDNKGDFHLRRNPIFKDLELELVLSVLEVNKTELVMFDNYKVSIGGSVPVNSKSYSIYPMIESVEEMK